ncbi:MAG: TRAP transporter substrate-binding protein [Hyphomicrobiales bacterium]
MKKRLFTGFTACTLCIGLLVHAGLAGERLAVVGSWSTLPLDKQFEVPFWTRRLRAASNGALAIEMTTHDQMGIAPGDVFRLLGDGVFDVAMTVGDYAVADAPELEGLDVPLLANTVRQAHAMIEAARPMVEDIFAQRFNAKLLAIVPYPPQIVFCRGAVEGLAGLEGKKVRGSGRMTTEFLQALGAVGVNIAFSEVPGALERGVIDCAVTGAGSGYSAGWSDVCDYLYPIPLGGFDPVVTAMNMDKWNALSPDLRKLIVTEVKTDFEAAVWAAAAGAFKTDIACMTGNGECPLNKAAHMTPVEVTAHDLAVAKDILTTIVLPDWAERVGWSWARRWNDSVGNAVGVTIPSR